MLYSRPISRFREQSLVLLKSGGFMGKILMALSLTVLPFVWVLLGTKAAALVTVALVLLFFYGLLESNMIKTRYRRRAWMGLLALACAAVVGIIVVVATEIPVDKQKPGNTTTHPGDIKKEKKKIVALVESGAAKAGIVAFTTTVSLITASLLRLFWKKVTKRKIQEHLQERLGVVGDTQKKIEDTQKLAQSNSNNIETLNTDAIRELKNENNKLQENVLAQRTELQAKIQDLLAQLQKKDLQGREKDFKVEETGRRVQKALKDLEEARSELERKTNEQLELQDKISDIETRYNTHLDRLNKQLEAKTRAYEIIKQERDTIERDYDRGQNRIVTLINQIRLKTQYAQDLSDEIASLKLKNEDTKAELKKSEIQLGSQIQALKQSERELEIAQEQLRDKENELKVIAKKNGMKPDMLSSFASEIDVLTKTVEENEKRYGEERQKTEELQRSLLKNREELKTQKHLNKILRRQLMEQNNAVSDLEKKHSQERDKLNRKLDENESNLVEITRKEKKLQDDLELLQKSLKHKTEEIQSLRGKETGLENTIENLENLLKKAKTEKESAENSVLEAQVQLNQVRARAQELVAQAEAQAQAQLSEAQAQWQSRAVLEAQVQLNQVRARAQELVAEAQEQAQAQLSEAQAQLSEAQAKAQTQAKAQAEAQAQLDQMQAQLFQIQNQEQEARQEGLKLRKKLDEITGERDEIWLENARILEEKKLVGIKIEELQSSLTEKNAELERIVKDLNEKTMEIDSLREEGIKNMLKITNNDELNKRLIDLQKERDEIYSHMTNLDTQLQHHANVVEELRNQLKKQTEKNTLMEEQLEKLQKNGEIREITNEYGKRRRLNERTEKI